MAKDYTKTLRLKGQERERLTKQLADLVGNVCDAIADTVEPGTEVVVPGEPKALNLAVYRYVSNIGSEMFLVSREYHEDFSEYANYVISTYDKPGTSHYLHGDFNRPVNMASRDTYLLVANRLPEIIQAFEAKEEEIIQALREGFETLRKLAGE